MSSPPTKPAREDSAPFLVQLFYRQGTFHKPEDFGSHSLPTHIPVYTWSDCTLKELALELAAAKPSALPSPAIGTRLAFQLVFPDLRNASAASNAQPRFGVKDLGSIIIGEGEPSVELSDDVEMDGPMAQLPRRQVSGESRPFLHGKAVVASEEGSMAERTAMVVAVPGEDGVAGETTLGADFLWENGGGEKGYQRAMALDRDQEAEDGGHEYTWHTRARGAASR
ncbi:hypothetical protein G7Z17_g11239 [Cylindrodendrum hubeiense]|uniref:Sin3 associated polypeptide p18 n=1 Tax=Cylindrodendrum hubeiense TaxID=595255 RepID=A0A9P5LAF4_9HYPO|nr:hypothetical protein G7Z17_g11239 [Cylindrodendrum hubeiense]